MTKTVTILTGEPKIVLLAQQKLEEAGVLEMAEWVREHRPDCVPTEGFASMWDLLPHDRLDTPHDWDATAPHTSEEIAAMIVDPLSDNEVLCEIAGRKCYDSFAEKAGKKTNRAYFEHIVSMDPLHASILYHAKMTFMFGGVSRKFSHQFIRNYVGSDRDEEGSPSQESTRFTHHYGWFVAPPYVVEQGPEAIAAFTRACQSNYDDYDQFLRVAVDTYTRKFGHAPHGGAKKDIYEAAAGFLNMSAETSFVWTTNPMALRKFLKERAHGAADAEICRFARKLAAMCFRRWPNLFLGADLENVRREVDTRRHLLAQATA